MYCLNRFRNFLLVGSPNRRANQTHDRIVKSFIRYGANFEDVTFPSRRLFGSCFSGIGYSNSAVPFTSPGWSVSSL